MRFFLLLCFEREIREIHMYAAGSTQPSECFQCDAGSYSATAGKLSEDIENDLPEHEDIKDNGVLALPFLTEPLYSQCQSNAATLQSDNAVCA